MWVSSTRLGYIAPDQGTRVYLACEGGVPGRHYGHTLVSAEPRGLRISLYRWESNMAIGLRRNAARMA